MISFLASLSFLYAFAIIVLIVYGIIYYRDFTRSKLYRRKFPLAFGLVAIACLGFLFIHFHAPLSLHTTSNLDHHFIRQDGFAVKKKIELGRSDTVNFDNAVLSRFVLEKNNGQVTVTSPYSEEPFYAGTDGVYKIVSASYPANGQTVTFKVDSIRVDIKTTGENEFSLSLNNNLFQAAKSVKKGLTAWQLFRDHDAFLQSSYYTHEKLVSSLKQIFLLRDEVAKRQAGGLKYFLSGKLFRYATQVKCGEQALKPADLLFNKTIADQTTIAWGIGFLDNNRNQFRIANAENGFNLLHRFPVSYPLTEEDRDNWKAHAVNKFLVAGSDDMLDLPPVFKEGFLFPSINNEPALAFDPVLLNYRKQAENKPLSLQAQWLYKEAGSPVMAGNKLTLPARSGDFNWLFTIKNTYEWELAGKNLSPITWQGLIFGSLLFFILFVLFTAWIKPAHQLNWVWQLLSCITLVMLTTRFFLYWRYKSFPPYEGIDLPSLQQLNSFWNFGVIILATLLLAIVFGWSFLKYGYVRLNRLVGRQLHRPVSTQATGVPVERLENVINKAPGVKRFGIKVMFFAVWLLLLALAGAIAAMKNFDSAVCRHLSIGLVIVYFVFVYFSYNYSPLVKGNGTSWWMLNTARTSSLVVSNPVKVLLSVSLLAVFAFIDIGFSIVFLNFLLFNEAFLCINYAIGGLSAGSNRNARLFGTIGLIYLLLFIINLLYAPYIFHSLLEMPQTIYLFGYVLFSILIAWNLMRVFAPAHARLKKLATVIITAALFSAAWLFFPRERVLDKAAMTKYRIDVQIMPPGEAITQAYGEGKTYEPVIRAAQNQWFINTFIYEDNNPGVQSPAFQLLPHAPQNKGAKYNAQATDLVASRFFIAEHGKWSVLLYILLLLLPTTMLASFYKLYPDFTSRINQHYPSVTAGFSVLNYVLISALLVILAATGKYIFFGQDLPFGSILSKQSVLVPGIFIVIGVWLFSRIPQEYYANRRKLVPGIFIFAGLLLLLTLVKPSFNKNKEFAVEGLAKEMDSFVELQLQPIWDHFDTAKQTRRLSFARKDQLFADSLRKLLNDEWAVNDNAFFAHEMLQYSRTGFSQHIDASRMLYLDIASGRPQLAVNPNYFRVEPPPHLQQSWKGNVYSDTSVYNIALWDGGSGDVIRRRLSSYHEPGKSSLEEGLEISVLADAEGLLQKVFLINRSATQLQYSRGDKFQELKANDSIQVFNPGRLAFMMADGKEKVLMSEPDAFMKNYYVNGNRFYAYPMAERFTWARNFAESIAADHTNKKLEDRNVFVSFDYEMMDSLSWRMQEVLGKDTAYKNGSEYGICIADGNGRLIAMSDFIKGMYRPDPNDKAAFNKAIHGDDGIVSQSLLRKQVGNINLLRLNPGPGSTLKPIVFAAIASQLDMDWDQFAAEGFSQKQHYYGGEKVAEYDFEKNNGRISKVTDYLKWSDNYYHSNLLLLGSYPKQHSKDLLQRSFVTHNPDGGFHWPYFQYGGTTYYLDQFEHWPGYRDGKADFGSDNSFVSIGLLQNFGFYTRDAKNSFDRFTSLYDSLLFMNGWKKSGFILPEYALFDQRGSHIDHRIPYDLFTTSFRGHVKGSSQVRIPPVKMLEAFGKLASQNRDYSLTLNPNAVTPAYTPFEVDQSIGYNNFLTLMREQVFAGMKEALFGGTAARLGGMLKNGAPYYYYAKTGTTGDNETTSKSKLLTVIISRENIADPGFSFRGNAFYTIYFTSQNGPAKQNEEWQAKVIKLIENSPAFKKYMVQKQF
jgi:hypothetical protein